MKIEKKPQRNPTSTLGLGWRRIQLHEQEHPITRTLTIVSGLQITFDLYK